MATRTRITGGLRPALLAAVVVSVILGIVGMHALSTHGLMGGTSDAAMDTTSANTIASTAHMSGHHDGAANADHAIDVNRAAGAAGAPVSTAPSVVADGDTGHGMGDMVMLCVAMIALGAGTLLLALLALRRVPRLWAHLPSTQAALFAPFGVHRGAGPPPVWEFSILRC